MYAYDNRGFRYSVFQYKDKNSNYSVDQTSDDSVDQTSGNSADQNSGYSADQNSDDSVDQNSHDSVDQTSRDSVFVEINDAHLTRSNSDSDSENDNDQKKKPDGDGEGDALLGEGIKFRNKPKKENQCLGCPDGICRFIGKHCYSFFTGPSDSYTPIKTALGFPFGFLLAYGLYFALIVPMQLEEQTRHFLGGFLILGVSCGYALSVELRCIICLLIPIFFGKEGRSYISAIAITYLISGPVQNIMDNGKEITRTLSCAAELSANHTRAKWELKMKPLEDAMKQWQAEGMYMNKVVNRVDSAFAPMKKEVRDQEDAAVMEAKTAKVDKLTGNKRGNRLAKIHQKNKSSNRDSREKQTELQFRTKMDLQCENVWNEGVLRCRDKFKDLEKRCLKTIPFIGYLLCLPMKMTFFCEIIRLIPGAAGLSCDAMDVVEPGFGETYVASEDMMNVMDENFEVNLQYKLVQSKEGLEYTSVEEIRKGTMNEFKQREQLINMFKKLLKCLLGFTFLRVIYSSYKYNKKYLSDFSFDNIYVSDYFKHIDKRRNAQEKRGLLPLKKSEKKCLVFPWSPKLMSAEKKKLSKGTFMILMRCLITGVVIYSDYLLFTVMDIIRRHSRVDYAQFGKHHIMVQVFGKGFMSNIVRMFIKSFDAKHEINEVSTNYECLPRPVSMDNKYIFYIYGCFGAVWLLMIVESYGLRIRRLVAAFFYRKREKARILYLFNDLYKKRQGYARHMRHQVRRNARKNTLSKKTSLLGSFRKEFPALCGWLKRFQSAKETCLICGEPESLRFVRCKTKGCSFGYCFECWEDVNFRCYACMHEDSDDSDLTEDESESSGEEEI
ncbi:E3 ubiquitin-protein ligase DCST1-like [Mytilus trossulus]|uniref:E3 ubiquitin-protein ligase DCST1-like n=1 Tax=Mytilus trossulus TaxID=6551 RepID=UPI003006F540